MMRRASPAWFLFLVLIGGMPVNAMDVISVDLRGVSELALEPDLMIAAEVVPAEGGETIKVSINPEIGLALPDGVRFPVSIRITDPDWWAPDFTLDEPPRQGVGPGLWHLWPAAPVALPAKIFHGDDAALPTARFVFCGCADEQGMPGDPCGETTTRVDLKGRTYLTKAPVGCDDLELFAEGFAPVGIDRVEIAWRPPKAIRLKSVLLLKGGSVHGMVISFTDGAPLANVAVRATPAFLSEEEIARRKEFSGGVRRPSLEGSRLTHTSYRGRFRISGLEPGPYKLELTGEGLANLRLDRIEIERDSETTLRPIEMDMGGSVVIRLNPPSCDGEPFDIVLYKQTIAGSATSVGKATSDPDGEAVLSSLPFGAFTIMVSGRCGSAAPRRLASQTIELLPGDRITVPIDLDLCAVSGTVEWRGDPVAARISAQKKDADVGVVEFGATADDGFDVALPGAGTYKAHVKVEDFESEIEWKVEECGEGRDIIVPSTLVAGSVVDEGGSPVAGATITASERSGLPENLRPLRSVRVTSDEAGAFELRGLAALPWSLLAENDTATSDAVMITLADDEDERLGITLVVRERQKLVLRALTEAAGAPIPQATFLVSWKTPGEAPEGWTGQSLTTDDRGEATLDLPRGVHSLNIVAFARFLPVKIIRLAPSSALNIVVPAQGGRVVMRRSVGDWSKFGYPITILRQQGATTDTIQIVMQARKGSIDAAVGGREMIVGPIAPGRYEIIYIENPEEMGVFLSAPERYPADAVIDVTAGQDTVLDAPF